MTKTAISFIAFDDLIMYYIVIAVYSAAFRKVANGEGAKQVFAKN